MKRLGLKTSAKKKNYKIVPKNNKIKSSKPKPNKIKWLRNEKTLIESIRLYTQIQYFKDYQIYFPMITRKCTIVRTGK